MELKRNKIGGILRRHFFDWWGWYLQQIRANEFSRLPCLWLAPIMDLRAIALWDITWGQVSEVIFHYNFVKKWLSAIDEGDGSTSWYGKQAHETRRLVFMRYPKPTSLAIIMLATGPRRIYPKIWQGCDSEATPWITTHQNQAKHLSFSWQSPPSSNTLW